MTLYVYPRIDELHARRLIDELAGSTPADIHMRLAGQADLSHPIATYYTTGTRVPALRLAAVRREVVAVATGAGFPQGHDNRLRPISEFDHRCAGILYRTMQILPADAAATGVWSFLSLVVLPDVVIWRYPNRAPVRLTGHPRRNALRRLWWRAHILGDGPDDPPAVLGEDQLVAIMERPTIGGDRRIARALCCAYLVTSTQRPSLPPMRLMREAAKRLTRLTPFLAVGALPDAALQALLAEVLDSAAAALTSTAADDDTAWESMS
jgi:hypothetical protein